MQKPHCFNQPPTHPTPPISCLQNRKFKYFHKVSGNDVKKKCAIRVTFIGTKLPSEKYNIQQPDTLLFALFMTRIQGISLFRSFFFSFLFRIFKKLLKRMSKITPKKKERENKDSAKNIEACSTFIVCIWHSFASAVKNDGSKQQQIGLFLDAFLNKCIRENKLLLRFNETERQIAHNRVKKMCRAYGKRLEHEHCFHRRFTIISLFLRFLFCTFVCQVVFDFFDLLNNIALSSFIGHSPLAIRWGATTHNSTLRNNFQRYIFFPRDIDYLKVLLLPLPFSGFTVLRIIFFA